MGVPVEIVAVGKCYVTEIGQVRRVLEIKEAMVKYESRGKTAHGRSWGVLITVSILRFVRDVEREVPCDYDPRYPPPVHQVENGPSRALIREAIA
jgi:hypothetical protein